MSKARFIVINSRRFIVGRDHKNIVRLVSMRSDHNAADGWRISIEIKTRRGETRYGCVLEESEFGNIAHARFRSAAEAQDVIRSLGYPTDQ